MLNMRVSLLVGLLFICMSLSVKSQSLPAPVHTGSTSDWYWSADSRRFIFSDLSDATSEQTISPGDVIYPGAYWYSHNTVTGAVQRMRTWPLQPSWSPSTYDSLMVVGSSLDIPTFVFPGPSNLLFGYLGSATGATNPMGVTDGQEYRLSSDAYLLSARTFLSDFYMRWNQSGTAVAGYNYTGGTALLSYMANFGQAGSLNPPRGATFFRPIAGRDFDLDDKSFPLLFDVATSSDEVLFLVTEGYNNQRAPEETLMIWKPLDPENSVVLDNLKGRNITAAAFSGDNDIYIIFLDEFGLQILNRNSGEIILLTGNYTSASFIQTLFSPDGKWLAASQNDSVYVMNLESLIPSFPNSCIPACSVTSFSLMDETTNSMIQPLLDGASFSLVDVADRLAIRANTSPRNIGSVVFDFNDLQNAEIDNTAPYEFTNWFPEPGTHTLKAIPYADAEGNGNAGTALTVTFTIPGDVKFLLDQIDTYCDNWPPGICNSLKTRIEQAERDAERENYRAAIQHLETFIQQVESLRGVQISDEVAQELVELAQQLVNYYDSLNT